MHITLIFLINILHRATFLSLPHPSIFLSLRLIPPLILTSKRSTFPSPPPPTNVSPISTQLYSLPRSTYSRLERSFQTFLSILKVRTTPLNLGPLRFSYNVTSRLDNCEGRYRARLPDNDDIWSLRNTVDELVSPWERIDFALEMR